MLDNEKRTNNMKMHLKANEADWKDALNKTWDEKV